MRNPKLELIFVTTALLTTGLVAQTGHTLPRGYEAISGGSKGSVLPFDIGTLRYMEVHSTWRGQTKFCRRLEFRRAREHPFAKDAIARTAKITLTLGDGDIRRFSRTFSTNYLKAPAEVLTKRVINLPDWRKKPTGAMTEWSIYVPFQHPWVYFGKTDFVWEMLVEEPSHRGRSGYHTDRASSVGNHTDSVRQSDSIRFGTGCVATGQNVAMAAGLRFYNNGPRARNPMQVEINSWQNPPNTLVQTVVGLARADLTIPGWCTKVYPVPMLFDSIGVTGRAGTVVPKKVNLPYMPGLIHVPVFAQTYALDTSKPGNITLSSGCSAFMPPNPGEVMFRYTYSTNTKASTGHGPYRSGSVITMWD